MTRRLPRASNLYRFQLDQQTYVFNGDTLGLVRMPARLADLLQQHEARPLDELLAELPAEDALSMQCLADGDFFTAFDASRAAQEAAGARRTDPPYEFSSAHLEMCAECNLRCTYCYADAGGFKGTQPRGFMSVATAREVARFFLSSAQPQCWMSLLGGEPLMNRQFREIVDILLEQAQKLGKTLHLQLSTNGTLLTPELARFLVSREISVGVSMDGTETVHDRARSRQNGSGSFAGALAGLTNMVAAGSTNVGVRVTVGRHNVEQVEEFRSFLAAELGALPMDISPVVGVRPATDTALTEADIPRYIELTRRHSRQSLRNRASEPRAIVSAFRDSAIMMRQPVFYHCSPGTKTVAFNVQGDIYPCCAFLASSEMRMGNVRDDALTMPPAVRRMLEGRSVRDRPTCQACWAKYLCAGGCLGLNHEDTGDAVEASGYLCSIYRAIEAAKLVAYAEGFTVTRDSWASWRAELGA